MVLAPAREAADGEAAFAARAVSLASAGREARTQVVHDAWSGDGAAAVLGGYAYFGADGGAPAGGPDWGIAAKMRLGFRRRVAPGGLLVGTLSRLIGFR